MVAPQKSAKESGQQIRDLTKAISSSSISSNNGSNGGSTGKQQVPASGQGWFISDLLLFDIDVLPSIFEFHLPYRIHIIETYASLKSCSQFQNMNCE